MPQAARAPGAPPQGGSGEPREAWKQGAGPCGALAGGLLGCSLPGAAPASSCAPMPSLGRLGGVNSVWELCTVMGSGHGPGFLPGSAPDLPRGWLGGVPGPRARVPPVRWGPWPACSAMGAVSFRASPGKGEMGGPLLP